MKWANYWYPGKSLKSSPTFLNLFDYKKLVKMFQFRNLFLYSWT